ncbi:MAG TPA: DCC1-like thiol-disulfide oxidoreductase family protein [Candidatus Aquilonibacter sp.]|nr:DCC1-like thiol-disulfide oxidoreductase family protein [Candidatus Aquilonibacter sp.]
MHSIVLYDGVCGLCNRFVQFILPRDRHAIFRFAPLQSSLAARILARHGADPRDLDTVYVVLNPEQPEECLLARSDAVLFALKQLGGLWKLLALLSGAVPRPIRDWKYRLVARYRYRLFGHYDSCPLPSPETRDRFLDS